MQPSNYFYACVLVITWNADFFFNDVLASPILSSNDGSSNEDIGDINVVRRQRSPLFLDILAEKKFHVVDYDDRHRGREYHHHHHYHQGPSGEYENEEVGYNKPYHPNNQVSSGGGFSSSSAQAGSFSGNQDGFGGGSQSQSNAASQSASFGFGPFQASFSASQANAASFNENNAGGRYPISGGYGRPHGGWYY